MNLITLRSAVIGVVVNSSVLASLFITNWIKPEFQVIATISIIFFAWLALVWFAKFEEISFQSLGFYLFSLPTIASVILIVKLVWSLNFNG